MFEPNDRKIFKYHNGLKDVYGDPVAIQRAYARELRGEDLELLEQHLQSDVDELSGPALEKFLNAARVAFGVKPLDPDTGVEGLTEEETMALVGRFFTYLADLKKKAETSPNSSPSTAGESSAPTPTRKSSSGSGSTGRGSRSRGRSK